jgi:hypothetical protein
MGIAQEQYDKFKNNELNFLNIENDEFIKLGFKIGFHSTLGNMATKIFFFGVISIGITNYVNLGERGV